MIEAYKLLELDRLLEICSMEATSALGRKRVLASVPLDNADKIRAELSLVEDMVRLLGKGPLPLQGLGDLSSTLKKLTPAGGMLDLDEYGPLKDLLAAPGRTKKFVEGQEENYPGLKALAGQLSDFGDLCRAMEKIFDPKGEIRDDASPELQRIRQHKDAETRRLHHVLEKILSQWQKDNLTQEDAPAFRGGKLLIPVKSEHRGRVDGVIADESASGATIFVEPLEAITIGNAIRRLEGEERREINRLLLELCDRIRVRLAEIISSVEILAQFDHIYARARLAMKLDCIAPTIGEDFTIKLEGARHPLLALKEGTDVVPLTLTLGGPDGSILLITGPNAGGKTVALKTVGLLCLMASCGLLVPAREGTEIPVLASLHCDIGDPQSLEQDLSTFTSHLYRLKHALEDSASPKLVLLDEIGSSTDPGEGSAIARASLLELRHQGALAIATTHQGTLKIFAHESEGIFNGSMEFDRETLRPTFRFRPGLPGSSYALEIGARVGFPDNVLAEARELLGEQTGNLEDLLARLNESLRTSEEARREADLKLTELTALTKLYSERLKELQKSKKETLEKAAKEAMEFVKDANRRIEAAVRAIREEQASKRSIQVAHRMAEAAKEKVADILTEAKTAEGKGEEAEPWQGQVGDWVLLEGLKDPVQVLALRKDGREAKLEVGGVHLWMDTQKLQPARGPDAGETKAAVKVSMTRAQPAGPGYELDLRGMTGDEAALAVEKYLSDCALSGWRSVRIIHGKGTGALRKRVWELLENYPGVKSFRYGRPEEGEFGVTIVELD